MYSSMMATAAEAPPELKLKLKPFDLEREGVPNGTGEVTVVDGVRSKPVESTSYSERTSTCS